VTSVWISLELLTQRILSRFSSHLSLSVILWPTVSRPVCLGIKRPSGTYDQVFIIVRQFRIFLYGALSLTRGRVCRLQMLLVLASAVIFGSESRWTRGHILLSQIRDFPFRRLLRLPELRWRYSTPPPHGIFFLSSGKFWTLGNVFTYSFLRNGPICMYWSTIL
jgi:hypothetical protein